MLNLTYRTQRRLRTFGTAAVLLLLVAIIAWFCWVVWLERYVVYDRDGAHIDFSLQEPDGYGELAIPPAAEETVNIYYNEGAGSMDTSTELKQLYGYYITGEMLQNISSVRNMLSILEPGTAVMMDVKSIQGAFYYPTALGGNQNGISAGDIANLIEEMQIKGLYTIARLPSLRDRDFGLTHVSAGLPLPQGYLWMDSEGCYWLNPNHADTIVWITQQVLEIKDLGFDEVVLSDWRFPDTEKIVFKDDKTAALQNAAKTLVTNCSRENFAVSFEVNNAMLQLPDGRCRMYLTGIGPRQIESTASLSTVVDKQVKLVFIAETNDTRYDAYGALRPLTSAETLEAQRQDDLS